MHSTLLSLQICFSLSHNFIIQLAFHCSITRISIIHHTAPIAPPLTSRPFTTPPITPSLTPSSSTLPITHDPIIHDPITHHHQPPHHPSLHHSHLHYSSHLPSLNQSSRHIRSTRIHAICFSSICGRIQRYLKCANRGKQQQLSPTNYVNISKLQRRIKEALP